MLPANDVDEFAKGRIMKDSELTINLLLIDWNAIQDLFLFALVNALL